MGAEVRGGKRTLPPNTPPSSHGGGGGKQHGRRRSGVVGGGASPQLGGAHREGVPACSYLHPRYPHPPCPLLASFIRCSRILRGTGNGGRLYPHLASPLPASSIPAALILHPRYKHLPSPLPASYIPAARIPAARITHRPPPPLPSFPPRCPRTAVPFPGAPGTDRRQRCLFRAGRSLGAGRAERGGRRPAPRAKPWGGWSGGGCPAPPPHPRHPRPRP